MNISSFKDFEQKQDYAVFLGHRFDEQISDMNHVNSFIQKVTFPQDVLWFILIHDHQVSHKLVEFM